MIARAPGKVVLSGAYAVLEGAPAVVAAVDRYALADAGRSSALVTPEVRAALEDAGDDPSVAPWFDASTLRDGERKLGLGSSAAILVASLAARAAAWRGHESSEEPLAARVMEPALRAHRRAQGGGTGIDVAASVLGGIIVAVVRGDALDVRRAALPAALSHEIWSAGEPASTPAFLAAVRALAERDSALYRRRMEPQREASFEAARALSEGDPARWLAALEAQHAALVGLGDAAGIPIVTGGAAMLHHAARAEGALVIPSGAGGGDVLIFAGPRRPSASLLSRARALGVYPLGLSLGAPGVHLEAGQA